MTVLAWQGCGTLMINLFTLIRHRRRDALGPWANPPDETWSRCALGDGILLFTLDTSFERCQALVDQIMDSGTLAIDGADIQYALEPVPRRHWAYRSQIHPSTTRFAVHSHDTAPKSLSTGVSMMRLAPAGWRCFGHFQPARGLSSLTWASHSTSVRIELAISRSPALPMKSPATSRFIATRR